MYLLLAVHFFIQHIAAPRSQHPPQQPVPGGKGGGSGVTRHVPGAEGTLTNQLPPPDPPRQQRDWHKQVQLDLRNHLVCKLVKAIFPSPEANAANDPRLRDLITYARKVEKEMFEQASDREEYYHKLAEKIYKIQKELQEKKVERMGKREHSQAPPNVTITSSTMPPQHQSLGGGTTMTQAIAEQQTQSDNMFASVANVVRCVTLSYKHSTTTLQKQEPIDTPRHDSDRVSSPLPKQSKLEQKPDIKPAIATSSSSSDVKQRIQPQKKKFSPDELRQALMPVWTRLYDMEEAVPFRVPVDPELLKIPVSCQCTLQYTFKLTPCRTTSTLSPIPWI